MAKPKVTEREVRIARSFLAATGGNAGNGYLLLAIIAWLRAMRHGHDPFWKSLARSSPQAAGARLAQRLKARLRGVEERGVLRALRDKSASYEQGDLFLKRLAKSRFDRDHYGYVAYHDAYMETKKVWHQTSASGGGYYETQYIWHAEVQEHNPMADAWQSLLGTRIPPKWFRDTVVVQPPATPPKVKTRPAQPRSLQHVLPKPEYILPYAAVHFYEGRTHLSDSVRAQD